MHFENAPHHALLGNTQTVAWVDTQGTLTWLALPHPDAEPIFDCVNPSCQAGHFSLAVVGPHSLERHYIGETPILQTLIRTPDGGKASILDFLPLRPAPTSEGLVARVHHQRLVRVVECHAGEVSFHVRFAPRPDGVPNPSIELDPNGLLFAGKTSSVVLQSEADVHLHATYVQGEFKLKAKEKRHFVVTAVADPDPDIPEVRATEADWELDGTIDYWVKWTNLCPFQGVQRSHVLRLASLLKATWASPAHQQGLARERFYSSPYGMIAPVALAAWGWEAELATAMATWTPDPDDALDRQQAAWLLAALATTQRAGLVEATLVVPHWLRLMPMLDALTTVVEPQERLAAWVGLQAGLELAEELLLDGDLAGWRQAQEILRQGLDVAPSAQAIALGLVPPRNHAEEADDPESRCWRVRQELSSGAYLQARRLMDQLLLVYGPMGIVEGSSQDHADPGELAMALWTAAEIYLQAAPTPGRVALPGELGD